MPNVPYPPGGLVNKDIIDFETCVKYDNDPLTITFQHPGAIAPTATGIFSPDILPGIFPAGLTIGPYLPVSNNTQLVVYFADFEKRKLYKNTIKIQTNCP